MERVICRGPGCVNGAEFRNRWRDRFRGLADFSLMAPP